MLIHFQTKLNFISAEVQHVNVDRWQETKALLKSVEKRTEKFCRTSWSDGSDVTRWWCSAFENGAPLDEAAVRGEFPASLSAPTNLVQTPDCGPPSGLQLADNSRRTRRPDEMVYLVPVRSTIFSQTRQLAAWEITIKAIPDRMRLQMIGLIVEKSFLYFWNPQVVIFQTKKTQIYMISLKRDKSTGETPPDGKRSDMRCKVYFHWLSRASSWNCSKFLQKNHTFQTQNYTVSDYVRKHNSPLWV